MGIAAGPPPVTSVLWEDDPYVPRCGELCPVLHGGSCRRGKGHPGHHRDHNGNQWFDSGGRVADVSEPEPNPEPKPEPEPSEEDKAALAWLNQYIATNGIDTEKLTAGGRTQLMMKVPCSIRCWRVGGPVTTKPGEPCPECGRMVPLPTVWDKLGDEDAF